MNRTFLFAVSCLAVGCLYLSSAQAQTARGGISSEILKEIKASYKNDPTDRALRNAVITNGMQALVVNSDNNEVLNDRFTYRVNSVGISNQERSGRCWLFTGFNVMRAPIISQYGLGSFFFSHNYSFFYDQLEKSNLFLQAVIDTRGKTSDDPTVRWLFKNPIGDGGQFTGVSDVISKYGLVPAEIMPETKNSNNTDQMSSIIARILRQGGIRLRAAAAQGISLPKLESQKTQTLMQVYRVLVMNLGIPPTNFTYTMRDAKGNVISTEQYTPKSFYDKFIGKDLRSTYVMLMNDPSRPYYRLYAIEYDRHMYDGKNWTYVNLPIDDIKQMAITSLKDSTMMYYSCDVGKSLDRKSGSLNLNNYDYNALLGIDLDMDKRERIESFDSGSSHAMTLVAVNMDTNGKPDKWMVENSWGADNGFKGHLVMTDEWFDAYTFRLVIDKKYVTPRVVEILQTKPTLLPAWDPMFAPEQ